MHCSVQHDPEKKKKEENIRLLISLGGATAVMSARVAERHSMGETSQVDWKRND
jgi:hypothetical protein